MQMKNKDKIIAARFSQEDAFLLSKVCNSRREDVSDFVRRSVRKELGRLSYLSTEDKKALGIKEVE